MTPLQMLRYHGTGAIERGEGEAIVEIPRLQTYEEICAERDALREQARELAEALQKSEQRIEQLCSTCNTLSNHAGLGNKVRSDDFTDIARAALAKYKGE